MSSGSEFVDDPEGGRQAGYSTILMGGVRDPYIPAQLDDTIWTRIRNTVGERPYEIVTRSIYGRDGVMGGLGAGTRRRWRRRSPRSM